MVDRAVADACIVHAADHRLKRLDVVGGVAVQLDIADVAGVGQRVVRRLLVDLVIGGDVKPHRDVERVGVIVAVGDARDVAVALFVHPDKPSGQALRRGGQQGEVHLHLLALAVAVVAHIFDNLQALLLHLVALAVVMAVQGGQRLGKADKADREGAVFEHLAHLIVGTQLVAVQPYALPHQEREVVDPLGRLNLKAVEQLVGHQIEHLVELLVEQLLVVVGLDGQARQIDRGEGQVAAAVADLAGRVIDVAHDAGAAAHSRHLRLGMAGFIVLQIKRRVQEDVVREQSLGADLAGELEQIVVRVALVVVDPFLHLKDVDWEDAGLAVAQARVGGQQNVLDDHPSLRGGVGAVVDRAERGLRAGAGVHGVQVVDKALHRLIGVTVGLAGRAVTGNLHQSRRLCLRDLVALGQALGHRGVKFLGAVLQAGGKACLFLGLFEDGVDAFLLVLGVQIVLHALHQLVGVGFAEGLGDAQRHAVIKVRDALAAVLVVLVGLDGDGRQRRVALDALRLAQETVAGGEAPVEQVDDVDLGAGGGQRIKIEVMDVDVALPVGLGLFRGQQVSLVVCFGARCADLQHAAHRGVAVDVGVVALDVALAGVHLGDLVDGLHQTGVRLTNTGAVGAVEDVLLGGVVKAQPHQLALNDVLDLLDLRRGIGIFGFQVLHDRLCHRRSALQGRAAGRLHCLLHSGQNLGAVKADDSAVPFDNFLHHLDSPSYLKK